MDAVVHDTVVAKQRLRDLLKHKLYIERLLDKTSRDAGSVNALVSPDWHQDANAISDVIRLPLSHPIPYYRFSWGLLVDVLERIKGEMAREDAAICRGYAVAAALGVGTQAMDRLVKAAATRE
jgi:hypothetical protein